jgi:hypothetical protein
MLTINHPLTRERRAANAAAHREFAINVAGMSAAERQAFAAAEIEALQGVNLSGLSKAQRRPLERRWFAALRGNTGR